ncbi:hypothetical protein MRX96_013717 [Rhipicephalus microplus]
MNVAYNKRRRDVEVAFDMPDEQFGRHFRLSKATVLCLREEGPRGLRSQWSGKGVGPAFLRHSILAVVGGRRVDCSGEASRGQHQCATCRSSDRTCRDPQQSLAWKFVVIVRRGCDVIFQWVPSHIGLRCNEPAEALAKEAHHPSTPVNNQRRRLFDAYGRLGLPHVSLDHLRFRRARRITLLTAFEAMLNFFCDVDLFTRL